MIEVKTTDTYRIDLNTVAQYRRGLIVSGKILEASSSILLVVGRQDTGDLEAQIRGSRYAWDIRLISVDALLRLMRTKEEVEDPRIVQRIHSILIPREFTRLDAIAEVLFSAAEDIKQDESPVEMEEEPEHTLSDGGKIPPVAFHEACVKRIQLRLGIVLVKRSRVKLLFTRQERSLSPALYRRSTTRIPTRTIDSHFILINRSSCGNTQKHTLRSDAEPRRV